MGYDQHQQSSSSGAVVAIVMAVLLIAILGVLAIAGAGMLWVRASSGQAQTIAMEQLAVAEARRAEVMANLEVERARIAAVPDPRLSFDIQLDREGNASVDGERIGIDELRVQLAKLKDETSNVFAVHVHADPECPIKHVIPVLDVCDEVGDIDVRIVSSNASVLQGQGR